MLFLWKQAVKVALVHEQYEIRSKDMQPSFVVEEDDYDDMSFTSEPNFDLQAYIKILEAEAMSYIIKFFKNKSYHCGGPLPNKLYSESSVDIVLGTRFSRGIRIAHYMIKYCNVPLNYEGELNYNIYFILNIVKEIKKHLVPVVCQAGILLLYLKYCKGLGLPGFLKKK